MSNPAAAKPAVAARRFADAVGICTHPNWRNTAWETSDWETAFLQTGVKFTRGKIGSGAAARAAVADLQPLFARGVKICVTVPEIRAGRIDRAATQASLDFLADEVGAHNLCGIESANEFNNPRRGPPDWARELRGFQQWLHQTVRANSAFNDIPLIGPSIWRRLTNDYRTLGNLEPNVDRGCLHYYTGGRRPTWTALPSRGAEGGRGIERSLHSSVADARVMAPNRPLWATEFGYAMRGPGAAESANITETAAAKYMLRGLFDLFGEGVEKIFIYALLDNAQPSPPRYHGLVGGDLRPRAPYTALRNLMRLFADDSRQTATATVDVEIRNDTPATKHWLFSKGDGSTLLVIYQDVDSYDLRTGRDLTVASAPIRVNLAKAARQVEVFTPTLSAAAQAVRSATDSISLSVADHVTVVRIAP